MHDDHFGVLMRNRVFSVVFGLITCSANGVYFFSGAAGDCRVRKASQYKSLLNFCVL
jgi:hypothetical protein